jgi:hypothetical protein
MTKGVVLRLLTHPTHQTSIPRQGKAPVDGGSPAAPSNTFELSNIFCIVHELPSPSWLVCSSIRAKAGQAGQSELAWWEVKTEGVLYTQTGGWRLSFLFLRLKGVGGRLAFCFAIYVEST